MFTNLHLLEAKLTYRTRLDIHRDVCLYDNAGAGHRYSTVEYSLPVDHDHTGQSNLNHYQHARDDDVR